MTALAKSHTNYTVKTQEKIFWCRKFYGDEIIRNLGYSPFNRTIGCICNRKSHECRGAHTAEEISPLKHTQQFNHINKVTFNWSQLYSEIIYILQKDKLRLKSEEHKRYLDNVSTMNFFDAIRTWREMACFYRKIAKELQFQPNLKDITSSSSDFSHSEDVPGFYLGSNLEDTAWSIERLARWCPEHQKFKCSIQSKQLVNIWDICLATGLNCKNGVHEINEKICEEDFLTGKCSCQTLKEISTNQDNLIAKILEASNKIQEIIKQESTPKKESYENGFIQAKSRKSKKYQQNIDPKNVLVYQISQYKKDLEKLQVSRQIHYSELGMVPFEIQYSRWTEEKNKVITDNQPKAFIKESWEHDLIDNTKITKSVVKIKKFGAKK